MHVGFLLVIPKSITNHATFHKALENFENVRKQLYQPVVPVWCDDFSVFFSHGHSLIQAQNLQGFIFIGTISLDKFCCVMQVVCSQDLVLMIHSTKVKYFTLLCSI